MSYSLPFRVLGTLHRRSTAALWRENVENVLLSKVPTTVTKGFYARFEQTLPSASLVQDRWREVAMTDLSPTGMVLWGARSERAIAHLWNAYNAYTDLVDRSPYTEQGVRPQSALPKVHEFMLEAYQHAFHDTMARNRRDARLMHPQCGLDLKDLTRILDAPSLVRDACDFFSAFPRAKVAELYVALGMHPRTAERRFAAEGVTAVALKRACALQHATRYVLWSDLTLAQIARRFGYTDAAHFHHEFRRATGGIPPSVYREAGRLMH
jgi:AraC-like DNA-binding protein